MRPLMRAASPTMRAASPWIAAVMLALPACMRASDEAPAQAKMAEEADGFAQPSAPAAEAVAGGLGDFEESKVEKKKIQRLAGKADRGGPGGGGFGAAQNEADEAEGGEGESTAPSRAWFPETFLFEPLVATDEGGHAKVEVRVPDRLTTWRVLALAHSRDGAQAGAEASFLGTLPVYVDPVVPRALVAGDEVELPIQVVNTTEARVVKPLRVTVSGAALAKGAGTVELGPLASTVERVTIRAMRPGTVTLSATLGDADAVARTCEVVPSGRPLVERRGGTLAAPRALDVELPTDVDPEATTARLLVFPGALAILRSELASALARSSPADDAYALRLAGRAPELLVKLGGEADPKAMRDLAIVAGQRALRATRAPEPLIAALFAEAALAHPDSPVLSRLGERLAATLARSQRPDGTFSGGDGWTLQRLLVATAECLRALGGASSDPRAKTRVDRARVSAEGAFERNLGRVEDGYTAAAILASRGVDGAIAEKLRKLVREKVRQDPDGARTLPVEAGVVRADGTSPSDVEATALAVLALAGDAESSAIVADLGARLLSAYDPGRGFGDGRTNLVALDAVLTLFKDPLPSKVTVTLAFDDRVVATGVLEGAKLRETLALDAPLPRAAGRHTYHVSAEPAVPGLGFSLALRAFTPWKVMPASHGLELAIEPPKEARVGRASELVVTAAIPPGQASTIELALPAGVDVEGPGPLELALGSSELTAFHAEDGRVRLVLAPRSPGQVFTTRLRVIPTLAGKLRSTASSVTIGAVTHWVPPTVWTVR